MLVTLIDWQLSMLRKEARLQQMHDRLASESAENREARLQQISAHRHDRRASKSAEEREISLHRDWLHVAWSQLPWFEQ